jgi:asparagine synthase (glutamine-hydrolysing)
MCGINGIFSTENLDPALIHKMNDRIIHRGPDGEGVYVSDKLLLGMRRLSIIDLSTGNQPIYDENNRFVIVFNGEIYNFSELRNKLIGKGHKFSTNSDTEVILHLYEDKGESCLDDLNGMFAFAIYDTLNKELFIARDRIGKKPLYYYFDHSRFYFASELKSIVTIINKKLSINPEALESYFALTFIPAPLTIYNEIYKLEPGYCMKIKSDLSYDIKKYWKLSDKIRNTSTITDKSKASDVIRNLLFDSVEKRMISDVPLGAFLSGGVDSSIIIDIMSKLSQTPIKTFSIGNTLKCYDESEKARLVANLFKTDHTEWIVDNNYICSIIDNVLDNFDEPFADSSAIPSYVVSELAKKHVKVVLTGDGGDELFAGYERYLIFSYLRLYKLIPEIIRKKVIDPFVNALPTPASLSIIMNKIKKIINNDGENIFKQYHAMQRLGFSEMELCRLFMNTGYSEEIKKTAQNHFDELSNSSDLSRVLYTDIVIGLEGDMLAKVDRATMQNSIEARCPFLDFRLVETSFSLSDKLKIHNNRLKALIKDTFEPDFPKGFLDKKKMGFGIPIGEFLKNELRLSMERLLSMEQLTELKCLNMEYIKELFILHCNGNRQTFKLWSFYVFALWFEKNISHLDLNGSSESKK